MGLFKKNYVDGIKAISERLESIDLREDDLILNFDDDVRKIEEEDIECIRLLQRLKQLEFEEHSELREIIADIDTTLRLELNIERIGVEFSGQLYHGSSNLGIKEFDHKKDHDPFFSTLGEGWYFTDSREMAINYGFYRTGNVEGVPFSVYKVRLKKDRNFIADLNDSLKVRAIYSGLLKYLESIPQERMHEIIKVRLNNFIEFLRFVIENDYVFHNIRHLLVPINHPALGKWDSYKMNTLYIMGHVRDFIKSIGYHGLRCAESGESFESIYPWNIFTTYVIFDPNSIEVTSEEQFMVRNRKLINVKNK